MSPSGPSHTVHINKTTDLERDTGAERDTPQMKRPSNDFPFIEGQSLAIVKVQKSSIEGAPRSLVEILAEYLGPVDDKAVLSLVKACRLKAADATEEEIVYFLRGKLALISRMRNINNPMGCLQTAVPRCFEGESFRHFRQAEQERKAAEARRETALREEAQRFRREQEAVLADQNASAEDRHFAQLILSSDDKQT